MMTNNYRRGYAFELRVKKYFESLGFYVVRSAGSHGVADLVAFQKNMNHPPLLIQCKRHGAISKAERKMLFHVATSISAWPVLSYMNENHTLIFDILDNEQEGHQVPFV